MDVLNALIGGGIITDNNDPPVLCNSTKKIKEWIYFKNKNVILI